MSIRIEKVLALLLFTILLGPKVAAQVDRGPMRSAFRIMVYVRNADNSPAPIGISVRLEADEGGTMDIQSTDSSGKVIFHPNAAAGYSIVVHQMGYRDEVKHVDLTLTPTASVNVQLVPEFGANTTTSPVSKEATIASAVLAIPEGAKKEFETGQKLLDEKHDVSGSIGHFRKAIKLYEAFPQAYTMLGLAFLHEQNFSESKAALERAIQLDPESGPSYIALGGCLNQMKDYPAAERVLVKGLEILPESPDGNYELAKTYWALHRWPEAEPRAVKAKNLEPDVPGVHVLMGNIFLQRRDTDGALKEFNEYLKLDPHGPMSDSVRAMVAKLEKASGTNK